jgi:hypothetical protein
LKHAEEKKKRKKTVEKERLGNDFKEERRKLKDLVTLIRKKTARDDQRF